jgi:polysaccharide pyruvyl transferase WcaK-like protein
MTCDPTLLWDFGSGSYPTLNHHSRYVALYAWTDDEQSLAVREFADRNSLALIGVGVKNKLCDFSYLNIGPQQWLGLMKGAEVVVTDFFHGVVFAILFDRPFFAFSAEKKRVKIEEFITDASLDHLLSDTVMPLPSLTIDDLSYGKDHLARFLDVKKASEEYLLRNISMCS